MKFRKEADQRKIKNNSYEMFTMSSIKLKAPLAERHLQYNSLFLG